MIRKKILLIIGCLLTWVVAPAGFTQESEEFRQWTDATGEYSIKAKLIGQTDAKATLEKEDGTTTEVEISALSAADQQYLAARRTGAVPAGAAKPRSTAARMNVANAVKLELANAYGWNVNADPIRNPKQLNYQSFELGFINDDEHVEVITDPSRSKLLVACYPGQRSAFWNREGYKDMDSNFDRSAQRDLVEQNARDPEKTFLRVFDLETGQSMGGEFFMPSTRPVAISPHMTQMLTTSVKWSRDQLHLWAIEDGKMVRRFSWEPFEAARWSPEATLVEFVDEEHVITANQRGNAALWNVSDRKLLWWCNFDEYCQPAVSAGGKQLVVKDRDQLVVISLPSGQLLGKCDCPKEAVEEIQISDSGRTIITQGAGIIRVFDVAQGKMKDEFAVDMLNVSPGLYGRKRRFRHATDEYLQIGSEYEFSVVDLRLRSVIWQYRVKNQGAMTTDAAGNVVYVTPSMEGSHVASAQIPHAEALQRVAGINPDSLLVVGPGVPVSLEVRAFDLVDKLVKDNNSIIDQTLVNRSDEGYSIIADKVRKAGWIIADDSPVKLIALMGNASLFNEYNPSGRSRRRGSINPKREHVQIMLRHGDETKWYAVTERYNDESVPNENDVAKRFKRYLLPQFVAKFSGAGKSGLGPQGVEGMSSGLFQRDR